MPLNMSLISVCEYIVRGFLSVDIISAVQSESSSRPHVVDLVSSLAPSLAPQTRSKAKAEDDKPSAETFKKDLFDFTPLQSLLIDGMDDEQIWAQLDLRTQTICRMLDYVLEGEMHSGEPKDDLEESSEDEEGRLREALAALEGGDIDMDEFLAKYGLDEEDELVDELDDSVEDSEGDPRGDVSDGEEDGEGEEDISPLRDPSDDENEAEILESPPTSPSKKRKRGQDSELDDDFFNLAEFNAYTERAEAKSSSRGRLAGDDSDEEDMEVDLFASVEDPVDLGDDEPGSESRGMLVSLTLP